MPQDDVPLSDAERAELELLRAEKRAREERAELARLRAEEREDVRVAMARERGRSLMEPGDDLSMPLGQKIVLVGLAVVVVAIVALLVFMPR